MSCVRYFNSTPHIVRFGMQSDEREESWMIFWRNGTRFKISVRRADVLGTRFETKWRELGQEPKLDRIKSGAQSWVRRWHLFCDCVISQCLDVLEELAPDGKEYWVTLKQYLRTPAYEIQVVYDDKSMDAKGKVVSGPIVGAAYELKPLPADEVGIETKGLQQFRSEDLRVVDRETFWKSPPFRVQSPDGTFFALGRVENYSRMVATEEMVNFSLDRIRNRWTVWKYCEQWQRQQPTGIPQILGYVTDGNTFGSEQGPQQDLVAGVLLTDFAHFRALADLVRDAKSDPVLLASIKESNEAWKSQTQTIVKNLHSAGMACGNTPEREWHCIDRWSVNIHWDNTVWLDPLVGYFLQHDGSTLSTDKAGLKIQSEIDFKKVTEIDLAAVEELFEKWLPEELAKLEAVVDT